MEKGMNNHTRSKENSGQVQILNSTKTAEVTLILRGLTISDYLQVKNYAYNNGLQVTNYHKLIMHMYMYYSKAHVTNVCQKKKVL